MLSIPSAAYDLLMSCSIAFTEPTFRRALVLVTAAILTKGDRTVTGMLRTVRGVATGDTSTYHRVFSRASWSLWPLAKILARAVLSQIPPDEPVPIPIDDTTAQHRGKCVYGKGCHHRHATLVSRFRADACLYAPVPKRLQRTGRPRIKGRKLSAPQQIVARRTLTDATVPWYGGQTRRVQLASGAGLWYKSGKGVVPIRWAFVRDRQGTHRDDYFYTTDPSLTATQIVGWFAARWPIETTFQELRAHLGFETTRQHVARSVLRTAPCLLGLFTVICLIFAQHAQHHRIRIAQNPW